MVLGGFVGGDSGIQMLLNNAPGVQYQSRWFAPPTSFYVTAVNMGGDRLLAVASANTTLSFQAVGSNFVIGDQHDCILIITQLQ
jgi:hypothetical protein